MKVQELIEQLQTFDPQLEVYAEFFLYEKYFLKMFGNSK